MCVIIIKQKKQKIDREILKRSAKVNPHGLGVIWLDSYELSYHKSDKYKILDTERPFIAHFRYATVGAVNKKNMHPFKCGNTGEYLMQNGTIYGMGSKEECDTKCMADHLATIPRQEWRHELEQYDCRFTTINLKKKSFQMYNREDWIKHDDVWYSKDNVLQVIPIAVYGTLKKGYSNYYSYLHRDSRMVGAGETKDKYPLVIDGLPYVVNQKGLGHNVEVDVFKVSPSTLKAIDSLERHPDWYKRERIPIRMKKSGKTIMAWIYFNPKTITPNTKLHKSYKQNYSWYGGYGGGYLSGWDWHDTYKVETNDRWRDLHEQETMTETLTVTKNEETYYCENCYDKLQYDGFNSWACTRCDDWYSDNQLQLI